jgi:hypothetical protein
MLPAASTAVGALHQAVTHLAPIHARTEWASGGGGEAWGAKQQRVAASELLSAPLAPAAVRTRAPLLHDCFHYL